MGCVAAFSVLASNRHNHLFVGTVTKVPPTYGLLSKGRRSVKYCQTIELGTLADSTCSEGLGAFRFFFQNTHFAPLTGGCLKGLDAFRFFF